MKKNLLFTLILAMMVVVLAVSASATVAVSYDLVEVTTTAGDAYRIIATLDDDEGDFRGWSNTIQFDYNIIKPVNKSSGAAVDIATASTVALKRAPLNKYSEYSDDYGDDISPSWTETTWTANGAESVLVFKTLVSDPDAIGLATATQGVSVFEFTFMLADGYTVDDFTADTFKVVEIEYPNGNNNFYGKTDGKTNNIVVTNNVVPEAVAITIPVVAGDKIYLQDGSVETADATGDYEVPATVGYVVVNSGKTTLDVTTEDDFSGTFQKTYYINGTAPLEAHVNAVVGSDVLSLRDRSDVINSAGQNLGDRNGMRFQMLSSQSSRKDTVYPIVESGFIMTAESSYVLGNVGEDYVLNMEMVDGGFAKKGVAYNSADGTDIRMDSNDEVIDIRGVFYNIPITEAGVQTVIVSRPYYQIGEGDNATYVYGEITESTLYDIAIYLKENKWDECEESLQEYINEIVGLVDGFEEIIEDEVIINIGSLYE